MSIQGARGTAERILAWLLWLITAVGGFIEIYLFRQVVIEVYLAFSNDTAPLDLIGIVTILIAAFVWLGYVIFSAEHLARLAGKPVSWTMFTWAGAIELLILILYFVV